ncbi:reverse transcriptase domain-containing protein [Tanacetum coccineum]
MRTRNSNFPNNSTVTIPRRRNRGRAPNVVEPELRTIVEVAPMMERTMEELLRAPTEGYGEAIILLDINADHFEIKTNLLQLVQASPFHSFERENPYAHINSFKRITSTLRFRDVPNDVIKLMMFPYSLEEAAKVWMNTTSRESVSKTDERIDKLADQISILVEIVSKKVVTPAPVKAVEDICVTCSGPHAWYNCPNTDNNQSSVCATTGSTAHIPPPVNPILIPEPDVLKTLPKPNIPYPSRRNDQKSRGKASNQMEKIFQIFQDLRFDISFADALLLMPIFAPTIRNLLMNKEKLLELAKIPLNENCSAMLLKKLPEKLGDPDKFLIPCDFPGIDVCHALTDLGTSINLIPLSIWKKLSLPELTPTRMTLELADRSITRSKGVAKDVFIKVGSFHFPTDFVVVDFEADPRHVNESIKIVNDTCEDSFEEINNLSSGSTTPLSDFHPSLDSFETSKSLLEMFTDEPALVFLPPPEDNDDEKEKQEVKNIAKPTAKRQTRITPCLKNFKVIHKESIFHKTPQISSIFAITSALPTIKPKDSLIMGDEHLSTFHVEEIIPIPRESEDTFDNNKGCDLTFCDNNMIFSDPIFGSKDNLTSSNDNSILKEDVQEENFRIYSNPIFELNDNFNSSSVNPLFNEMVEDVESENSNVSYSDESDLLHTPFSMMMSVSTQEAIMMRSMLF